MAALGIARAYIWEPIAIFYIFRDMKKWLGDTVFRNHLVAGLVVAGVWMSLLGISQKFLAGLLLHPIKPIELMLCSTMGTRSRFFSGRLSVFVLPNYSTLILKIMENSYSRGFYNIDEYRGGFK